MTPQQVLDSLDFAVPCDIGHPGGYGHPITRRCDCRAEYTVSYHHCTSVPNTGAGTWCGKHLRLLRLAVEATLEETRVAACPCGHRYDSPDDFVWNVTPLKAETINDGQ